MNPPNERGRGFDSPDPNDYGIPASSPPEDTAAEKAQLDLESYRAELATTARDAGLESAERNDAEWSHRVGEWIYDFPPGYRFTADTIRSEFGSSNATGSVIRSCAKRRVIVRVGYTESTSVTRHAGTIAIWERT